MHFWCGGPCLWEFYHRRHSKQFQWYCTFQITTVQEDILGNFHTESLLTTVPITLYILGSFKILLVFTRDLVTEDILCIFDVGSLFNSSNHRKQSRQVQWYCTFQITTVQEDILGNFDKESLLTTVPITLYILGSFKILLVFTRDLETEDILYIFDVGSLFTTVPNHRRQSRQYQWHCIFQITTVNVPPLSKAPWH
jgi:hypothetical protein